MPEDKKKDIFESLLKLYVKKDVVYHFPRRTIHYFIIFRPILLFYFLIFYYFQTYFIILFFNILLFLDLFYFYLFYFIIFRHILSFYFIFYYFYFIIFRPILLFYFLLFLFYYFQTYHVLPHCQVVSKVLLSTVPCVLARPGAIFQLSPAADCLPEEAQQIIDVLDHFTENPEV